ncbi:T9SS type A sorting domain-containing protein [Hymenobacter psoromatis]|uniref:T9SS type A sorting domain-containing protein n=1 Tax=Hymenobacter psoromatis TaxID=1484116 RepID=UPI001CBC4961|nr:T9SS type A sorting domain-containing protein [Hymenobacter psoromatis]
MTLPIYFRLPVAWWMLLVSICSWPVVAQAQSLDSGFAPTRLSSPVTTNNAVQQADGRLIISLVPPAYYKGSLVKGLIRVNLDGSLDQTFGTTWLEAGGAARSMRVLPNGNILLVGGSFGVREFDLYRQGRVVVLHPDGTLNRQFGLRLDDEANAGEVQPDGKLLIGGSFTTVNGAAMPRLARLLPTGQLDPSFVLAPGGFSDAVTSIQVQPDGRIMVGGDFTSYGGVAHAHLVRLLPDGRPDPSFEAAIPAAAFFDGFAVQPDSKVVVNAISPDTGQGLFRLSASGSRDNTFASSTYSYLAFNPQSDHHLVVQPSGSILLAGSFQQANGQPCPGLVRVSPTGTLDSSSPYHTDWHGVVTALCLLADGQALACGAFTLFNHQPAGIVQVGAAGQVSPFPLPVENIGSIAAVLPLDQGRLLVGGNFNTINGIAARNLAFLRADGTVDVAATQALPPLEGTVQALAPGPQGTLYVGGDFYESAAPSRRYLLRLTSSGSQDLTFVAPSLNASVSSLAAYPNGRLLVGGSFSMPKAKLLRLTSQGALDDGFTGNFGTYVPWVNALVLQRDERLAALTLTTSWQLTPQGAPTGRPTSVPHYLHALAVQPDGGILVAGEFTDFDGTPHQDIVRLLPTGAVDASFDAGVVLINGISSIKVVAVQDDGRILCAGYFTSIQGQAHRGIARLLASGQVDDTFADQVFLHPEASCLVIQAGGRLLVGASALDPQSFSYLQPVSILTQGLTCLLVPGLTGGAPVGLPLATTPAASFPLSIYPIPAQQEFTVDVGSASTQLSVVVYDVLGRAVRQASGTGSALHISVVDLPAATYVLNIRVNQAIVYRKLVVQH